MSKEEKMDQSTLQRPTLESKMVKVGQHTAIKELYAKGTPKKAIDRFLGINIKTVRRQLKKVDWAAYGRNNSKHKCLLEGEQEWLMSRMKEVGYNAVVLFR
jgi:DNA invertase Pin-like site-specific DNA recombinase